MKTYSQMRIWNSRLVAIGLGLSGLSGLSGLTCLAAGPAAPANTPAGTPGATTNNDQTWEDQFSTRLQHIQGEMDNLFRDSLKNIDTTGKDLLGGAPKFDAYANIQDHGDSYVASFYLPKRDLANVKVNVRDDVLTVKAKAEQMTKSNTVNGNTGTQTEMLNEYEQLVTLPGPVDASKMKVDKHGDTLVVTIPKKDDKSAK